MVRRSVLFISVLAVGLGSGCTRSGGGGPAVVDADASESSADAAADGSDDGSTTPSSDLLTMEGDAIDHPVGEPPSDGGAPESHDVGPETLEGDTAPTTSVTEGPYRACQDFEVISPSTGCICSAPGAGSTVCLPTCKTDADCPAPPVGAPAVKCLAAAGGLFSYCVMPCQADAGASICPTGYTCSGYRSIIGPFCAVPGSDISDISSRYDTTPFSPAHPATPVAPAQRLCKAPVVVSGELAPGDLHVQRGLRINGGCVASPSDYLYYQDVYALELVGPGPHRLELDSCGHAATRMSVMLFQYPGSSSPYDTGNVCRNLVFSADPSARADCGGGVSARLVGLQPGTIYVVVSTEGPDLTGLYELTVKSDTSACP